MLDIESKRPVLPYGGGRNLERLVDGIVENLDFQFFPRVVEPTDAIDQPVDDIELVEERELDRHNWEFREGGENFTGAPLSQVIIDHHESVRSKGKEDQKGNKIKVENKVGEERIIHEVLSEKCQQHSYHPATVSLRISSVIFFIASRMPSFRWVGPPPEA